MVPWFLITAMFQKIPLVAYFLIKGAGRLSSSTTVMRAGARPLGVRTDGAENT